MASSRRILQLRFNLDGLGGSEVMTNVSYVVQVELQDPDNDERLFTQKEPVTVDKSDLDTGDLAALNAAVSRAILILERVKPLRRV